MESKIKFETKYNKLNQDTFKKFENKIKEIHRNFYDKKTTGYEFTDWIDWNDNNNHEVISEINEKVKKLKEKGIEKLVVIGIGGSYLGPQAAIDLIKGKINSRDKVIFVGTDISSTHYSQVEKLIMNSKWALCIISKSGTTLEPSLAFRHFKNLLKEQNPNNFNELIIAITDKEKGALRTEANANNYTSFIIPDGIGGRFSIVTPVGLFPMAFAGVDIESFLIGCRDSYEKFRDDDSINNEAYKYAVSRYALSDGCYKNKRPIELFVTYDYDLLLFQEWIKQLFAESEGKDGKGIFPASAMFTRELHSLGQLVQSGPKNLFETSIIVEENDDSEKVKATNENFDGLEYLVGRTYDDINKVVSKSVIEAHYEEGDIPNNLIYLNGKHERDLGQLVYFFFITVTMTAYLFGVNPFNQPGVEIYKKKVKENLKK